MFKLSLFLSLTFIINVSAQKKYNNKFIKEKKILAQILTNFMTTRLDIKLSIHSIIQEQ